MEGGSVGEWCMYCGRGFVQVMMEKSDEFCGMWFWMVASWVEGRVGKWMLMNDFTCVSPILIL